MHLWRSNSQFLEVFYVLKESFKQFVQLRYAISTFLLFIKENTVVLFIKENTVVHEV